MSHLSSRALESASERIIDVQADDPEEADDDDAQDAADPAQESRKDI